MNEEVIVFSKRQGNVEALIHVISHNTRGREIAKSAAENKGFPRKVVVASKNTYRDEYTPSDYVYDLARSHYYCLSSSLSEIVAVLLSLCDDRANTY